MKTIYKALLPALMLIPADAPAFAMAALLNTGTSSAMFDAVLSHSPVIALARTRAVGWMIGVGSSTET